MSNIENKNDKMQVADALYRLVNPESKMCTPNSVYITVCEKWYPQWGADNQNLSFYDWCIKNKQPKKQS